MSKPFSNCGIWGDALIVKYMSLYLLQSLNLWNVKAVLEECTTISSLSYRDDIDLKIYIIDTPYANDQYYPVLLLNIPNVSSESNDSNTSQE